MLYLYILQLGRYAIMLIRRRDDFREGEIRVVRRDRRTRGPRESEVPVARETAGDRSEGGEGVGEGAVGAGEEGGAMIVADHKIGMSVTRLTRTPGRKFDFKRAIADLSSRKPPRECPERPRLPDIWVSRRGR
jgi:CubicO group peptidase (beta-lactamase class C family)